VDGVDPGSRIRLAIFALVAFDCCALRYICAVAKDPDRVGKRDERCGEQPGPVESSAGILVPTILDYDSTVMGVDTFTRSATKANSWEFPLLLKKDFNAAAAKPYGDIGIALRHVGGTSHIVNTVFPTRARHAWRGLIAPRLKIVQLEWATFQIMRRTHASLSRQPGIGPKLVADQLGHGLGVNLDVYTVAALDKRQDAMEVLESALARRGSD